MRASYHQGASQFTLSYNPTWCNYQRVYDHDISSCISDEFRTNLIGTDRTPFNSHSQSLSAAHPTKREHYIKDNRNMITVSLTYTTNFGTIFRTGRRTLNNTDTSSFLLKL